MVTMVTDDGHGHMAIPITTMVRVVLLMVTMIMMIIISVERQKAIGVPIPERLCRLWRI